MSPVLFLVPYLTASVLQHVVVPLEPSCVSCSVRLQSLGSLGDRNGSGAILSAPYSIAQDQQGRYFVAQVERPELPLVFARNGSFLGRLGRQGDGPGEFRQPRLVLVSSEDSIIVFDEQLYRFSVFSPSLRHVRSSPFPSELWSAAFLADKSLVVNAQIRDAERIGLPLHLFDRNTTYVRSFGADRPMVVPGELFLNLRWVAAARDGRIWALRESHRYALELWDQQGRRWLELEFTPSWFQPYEHRWMPTPTRAPAPYTSGLWQDSTGYVWTLVIVPDDSWEEGLGRRVQAEGQEAYEVVDVHKVYDTLIEVIDPDSRRVVARRRLDSRIDLVVRPNLIAESHEDPDGFITVRLWSVQLFSTARSR